MEIGEGRLSETVSFLAMSPPLASLAFYRMIDASVSAARGDDLPSSPDFRLARTGARPGQSVQRIWWQVVSSAVCVWRNWPQSGGVQYVARGLAVGLMAMLGPSRPVLRRLSLALGPKVAGESAAGFHWPAPCATAVTSGPLPPTAH